MSREPVIIAVVNQKGGAGKTTTAIALADCLKVRGLSVLLVDADTSQGTLTKWGGIANDSAPPVAALSKSALLKLRKGGHLSGFDFLIIDAPGYLEEESRAALAVANVALIPMRPSQPDIDATANTLATLREARVFNPGLRHAILLTQSDSRSRKREETARAAFPDEPILISVLHYLLDHQDAVGAGCGVCSYDPSSTAANEVETLTTELLTKIEAGDLEPPGATGGE